MTSVLELPPLPADESRMTNRAVASAALALAALAPVVGSAAWAHSTFDFWEAGPLLGSICVGATASAGALYAATRRIAPALMAGLITGGAHFILLAGITLSRWEG
jgi:hypothetical protein